MQTSDADNFFRTEADRRREKADKSKNIGDPIDLGAKVIRVVIRENEAWTAESTRLVRRVNLETGHVLQVYKGHNGPVTCLVLHDFVDSNGKEKLLLITGSWDKTIKLWDTETKALLSETIAHDDFVKTLCVIPSSQILVSGSSDKTAKLWDLASAGTGPLTQLGALSGHRRPVDTVSATQNTVITGDSMGAIKIWTLEGRASGEVGSIRATEKGEVQGHSTGVNDMAVVAGALWIASTDKTVTRREYSAEKIGEVLSLEHVDAVKCILVLAEEDVGSPYLLTGSGEAIRLYDTSELTAKGAEDTRMTEKKEVHLLAEIDVHSHPVTSLQLWLRKGEPWIVSASLDGTLRRWKLEDMINNRIPTVPVTTSTNQQGNQDAKVRQAGDLTEEEEHELAELMGSDED